MSDEFDLIGDWIDIDNVNGVIPFDFSQKIIIHIKGSFDCRDQGDDPFGFFKLNGRIRFENDLSNTQV